MVGERAGAAARSWVTPAAALLLVTLCAIRLATLGSYPLFDPSEGRYAEIAREMVVSDDWVTPRLEPQTPFWGKPPLYFWAAAAAFRTFGTSAFAARLASFAFALVTVVLAGWLGVRLFGRATGLLGASILASSALFFVLAGTVITDPALLASVTLACAALPLALRAEGGLSRRLWTVLFFTGLGASTLAKGLVGPVLVCGIAIAWGLLVPEQRRALWRLPWLWGGVFALALAVPWHLAAEIRTPGFLEYYFWGEHVQRFLVRGYDSLYGDAHQEARGTIWLFFAVGALPWSLVFALFALRKRSWRGLPALRRDPWAAYLAVWTLVPLIFFTLSRNIMLAYALPALPPFAIGVARALTGGDRSRGTPLALGTRVFVGLVLAVPLLTLFASLVVLPPVGEHRSQRELVERLDQLDPAGTATLVYTDEMPPSGDFYAGGRAVELEEGAVEEILAHIEDGGVDYYAIEDDDLRWFPAVGFERTVELGRFGDYMLRGEIPGAGAGADAPRPDQG